MSLKTSSNGQLLYICNAGDTIDIYDGSSYKYLRKIVLPGDVTTPFYVVPKSTRGPRTSDSKAEARSGRRGSR